MAFEQIIFEQSDGIARITLNRPEVLNAITPVMISELYAALLEIENNPSIRTVILTGAGRAFSAGVDLKSLGERALEQGGVGPILDEPARAVIEKIEELPKVVIAKINGFCFTGALEIALGCDLIYVAQDAKLGDTHTKWGLRPTWGMSQRLPRAVGFARAKELSFTAATFTGKEAEKMGLANRAVPLKELDALVDAVAEKISENSGDAIGAYKVLYNEGATRPLEEGLEFERTTSFEISDTSERLSTFNKG